MDAERAMQFIIEAQAQQAVTLQAHADILRDHAEQIASVTNLIGRLAQAELALTQEMRGLRAVQSQTDERLNLLIEVVDKLVRRNGHPQ